MNHLDESARKAIARSRILIALAACCCIAALGMGFAAIAGTFSQNAGLAAACMALLVMAALLCGALGATQRSAARMKGWAPARERTAGAGAGAIAGAGIPKPEGAAQATPCSDDAGEQADPMPEAQACNADTDAPDSGQAPDHAPEAADAPTEAEGEPSQPESAAEQPAGDDGSHGPEEPIAYKAASDSAAEAEMTEGEMLVAAAEALLEEAASRTGAGHDGENPEEEAAMLSDEIFMELAGTSPFMRKDDEDGADASPQSTIRTRRIAKERILTVDKMLSRAEDAIAVSRDIARSSTQDPAFAGLASMLRASGILETKGLPQVHPIKLTRNDRYWMGSSSAGIPQQVFDALLSLEAIFNINQDIQTMLGKKPDMEHQTDTRKRIIAVLSETSSRDVDFQSKIDYLPCAYAGCDPQDVCSDWALRYGIATAAENAKLPFRITFDMMTNAREGAALVLLEIPRPACFGFVGRTPGEMESFARDYAIRSAVFMARAAFKVGFGGQLKRVVVCCHPHDDARTLLSVEATPENLSQLMHITGSLAPIPVPANCPSIRLSCEHDWLEPVEPHMLPGDDALGALRYIQLAESSTEECSAMLSQATGARLECDLGTRAEAPMEQAWMGLGKLGDTVESAVSAIKVISDEAETQDVREGCDRAMRALVEGTVEPDRLDLITRIYRGEGELERALEFGLRAYTSQSLPDMERAVSQLTGLLDAQTQISLMDDTETAFRYFHSIPDRIHYNLTTQDPRKVSLVPHSYYSANEMTAYLLCQIGRAQDAEPFAREIRRIAPFAPASATILARVLERQGKVLEAIEVVNEALLHATTVHDAALCYYRMAYLQWRTGREDLANAAYRLTVALHTEISKQARQELDELLASNDDLSELSPTAACKKLAEAGMRIWDLEGFRDKMAQAAILCADQQLFTAASQLTLSLLEFQKDDAVTDVYRSFSV